MSAVLQFEIYNPPDLSQRLDYSEGFLFSYPLTAGFGISKSYLGVLEAPVISPRQPPPTLFEMRTDLLQWLSRYTACAE